MCIAPLSPQLNSSRVHGVPCTEAEFLFFLQHHKLGTCHSTAYLSFSHPHNTSRTSVQTGKGMQVTRAFLQTWQRPATVLDGLLQWDSVSWAFNQVTIIFMIEDHLEPTGKSRGPNQNLDLLGPILAGLAPEWYTPVWLGVAFRGKKEASCLGMVKVESQIFLIGLYSSPPFLFQSLPRRPPQGGDPFLGRAGPHS